MTSQAYRFLLVSDFNMDTFRGYLVNDVSSPRVEAIMAPFGQVLSTLADPEMKCWQQRPDYAVVWTQPETIPLASP